MTNKKILNTLLLNIISIKSKFNLKTEPGTGRSILTNPAYGNTPIVGGSSTAYSNTPLVGGSSVSTCGNAGQLTTEPSSASSGYEQRYKLIVTKLMITYLGYK